MKVLSFRATAIEYYQAVQQNDSLVKKKISMRQWVRGRVARIDQMPGSICVVYMTVEEFEGGFDGERLPPGFYYGELPAVTIGDPSNQRMEFVVNEDTIQYYPVGRSIRIDAKLANADAVKGVIIKTSREPSALKPYWRVTVEYPAPPLAFEHYAIRDGDTVHLNYESQTNSFDSCNLYAKPSLKSIRFRVPERYRDGFKALHSRGKKVCIRLEDNSQDVSGYVDWMSEGQVEVQVTGTEQSRRDYHAEAMTIARNLHMKRMIADEFVTPEGGFAKGGILRRGELTFALNFKETDDMKIYEAVVVKTDEQGVITDIVKVVPPFLAKTDQAAKDAVLVDYAVESGLAGKDLTGIKVLVRTFQSVV